MGYADTLSQFDNLLEQSASSALDDSAAQTPQLSLPPTLTPPLAPPQ